VILSIVVAIMTILAIVIAAIMTTVRLRITAT
jgi:hypothetical protein